MLGTSPNFSEKALAADPVAVARAINELNVVYCKSRILHSAVELGLFSYLGERQATAEEIFADLGLQPALAQDFLDALTGLGLLDRVAGKYRNSAGAAEYLVPGKPTFIGGAVRSHGSIHFGLWGRLTDALRDGRAQSGLLANSFKKPYDDPEHVRRLMDHMDAFNNFVNYWLDSAVDWKRYSSFVDFGGARGNTAVHLVRTFPHLTGTVFDLPQVEPLFDEHVAAYGAADRVRFHAGDFYTDALPQTDVAIIGHTLHDWPADDRRRLIARLGEAVRPGGALIVYDAMIDDERADPDSLVQSLRCRMIREGGSEYTAAEAGSWAENAGFEVADVIHADTITNDRILVAVKR
ncbi:methyltransferase [Crossiella sp. CA-258035]|uniref:methyltransferase n=1 Tax=Crossiella sp. CA-258035 TaxID=2981138 RepID=UPI0024BD2FAC|nr:methyltransferase [Crossiella sp. CA-258035]WHT23326.1 methyltransferase [Crossiella sp. CA-258035]